MLFNLFRTSVGKKIIMSATGLCFCGFIAIHLFGNLMIYGGKSLFNAYVKALHSLGALITVFEFILLALALLHVTAGAVIFVQNLRARPRRYFKNKSSGGRTPGSATMPYTGLIMALFIIFHLMDFHFAPREGTTVFDIAAQVFSRAGYVIAYVIAVIAAALHISHGFWSAFQTLGAHHPRYMPAIKGIGILFSLAVGIGFGLIPIFMSFSA
ncbi:Succinate dehydrogenase [Candidatus Desulfarcum epimagneticum]|uniref:Succinate dehydrogenase n=1 Tax=uncultured Desulfobacteraceae bacterium TaxID=218296 RepID=A0A484HLD4_9BACT|nr:Succinate dehydrogenase [uncultured Desulfobacteraceae bacterium]